MDGYTGMKRSAGDVDGAIKRQKTADESKVLHVRGLPSFCTEDELISVCQPFGKVVKCLILEEKHQAFVQMESVEQATQLLSNLEFSQPNIRSKAIYFQYSSRQEVEVRKKPQNMGGMGGGMGASGEGSPTILITVTNVTVPVTLDNILQICKPYGEVLKIITFQKGADFQALVQMHSVEAATQALTFLEGKDMFQGCCHLHVGFSKRHNLIVKQNNHKSRDFTQGQGFGMENMGMAPQMMAGGYGVEGMGGMMNGGAGMMNGAGMMGQPDQFANGDYGNQRYGQSPFGQQAGFENGMGGGMGGGMGMVTNSSVVLVSELNEKMINADTLFTLFGVYGDILRVKILFNKRNTALIQFSNPQQAQFALTNLQNCPLQGTQIKVAPSKFNEVKVPRDPEAGGSNLTKDYSESPNQRYRGRAVNPKNVNPPSQVLHIANLHDHCTEQELRDLFGAQQNSPPTVEFFKTSRKMCYIAMDSIESSVNAVVNLHQYNLGGNNIRVSFSPKDASSINNSDM